MPASVASTACRPVKISSRGQSNNRPLSIRTRLVADARAIVALGGPLLGNNLSITGMAFADTVMAGRLGARRSGGLAVGVGYYNLFLYIGLGVLMAMSPCVAHAYGANDTRESDSLLRVSRGGWCSRWQSLLVTGMRQVEWVLPAIGISPEMLPVAIGYVHAMSWGMPGLLGVLLVALHERRARPHQAHHVHRFPRADRERDRQLDLHVRQVRRAGARRRRLRRRDGDFRVADVLRDVLFTCGCIARIDLSIFSRASIRRNRQCSAS